MQGGVAAVQGRSGEHVHSGVAGQVLLGGLQRDGAQPSAHV